MKRLYCGFVKPTLDFLERFYSRPLPIDPRTPTCGQTHVPRSLTIRGFRKNSEEKRQSKNQTKKNARAVSKEKAVQSVSRIFCKDERKRFS